MGQDVMYGLAVNHVLGGIEGRQDKQSFLVLWSRCVVGGEREDFGCCSL